MGVSGADLSRAYYHQVVGPAVRAAWPGLRHAARRLGSGSDVLGFDDDVSRDHDWGLRLNLLVPRHRADEVAAELDRVLPERFAGYPTRFPTTWDPQVQHRVQVEDFGLFVRSRIGVDAVGALSVQEWLSLTGQAVLEVVAGPVFADTAGDLTAARARLIWYPEDVWRYVVAADWARLAQELPFVGRTAERGDNLGSGVITARLVSVASHLAHLLDRRWPPYSKWIGTSLTRLPNAAGVVTPLQAALAAEDWPAREAHLVTALRFLHDVQRRTGLPTVDDPVEPFWDRRYYGVRTAVVELLEEAINDPAVRVLPRGVGSVEQRSDNVDVLMHPRRRSFPNSI